MPSEDEALLLHRRPPTQPLRHGSQPQLTFVPNQRITRRPCQLQRTKITTAAYGRSFVFVDTWNRGRKSGPEMQHTPRSSRSNSTAQCATTSRAPGARFKHESTAAHDAALSSYQLVETVKAQSKTDHDQGTHVSERKAHARTVAQGRLWS